MTIEGVKKQLDNDETNLDETANISINTKNILKTKLNKISKLIKEIKKQNGKKNTRKSQTCSRS